MLISSKNTLLRREKLYLRECPGPCAGGSGLWRYRLAKPRRPPRRGAETPRAPPAPESPSLSSWRGGENRLPRPLPGGGHSCGGDAFGVGRCGQRGLPGWPARQA